MAELKSITGDEPYSGVGNAPAPIPRPMGFWGRPRYAPVTFGSAFMGGGPYGGGYYGPYGGADRFTSVGYSPYEEDGQLPLGDLLAGAIMGSAAPTPYSPYSPYSRRPAPALSSPTHTPFQSPFRHANSFDSGRATSPFSRPPTGSSGSVSMSEATGGFYKGKGNEMIGR